MECLADAGKLITDVIRQLSLSLRFLVIPKVEDKRYREILTSAALDTFLFGCDLAERIKNMKAVTTTGLDIFRRPHPLQRNVSGPGHGTSLRRGSQRGGTSQAHRSNNYYRPQQFGASNRYQPKYNQKPNTSHHPYGRRNRENVQHTKRSQTTRKK